MKSRVSLLIVLSLVLVSLSVGLGQAQGPAPQGMVGTAFTYQGQLKQNGLPVSGVCDFRFSLWDAEADGAQVGDTVALDAVPVSKGLFTVLLDFGPYAFNGDERWLGIDVRCPAGVGDYTPLSPRQALTPAPYAIFASTAPWGGLLDRPAGLDDGDDDTLAGLMCAEGEVAKWDGAAWACGPDDDTLRGLSCAAGQVVKWDGGAWACAEDENSQSAYTAGAGLVLTGNEFSVVFAGTGAANTAARSDHDHDAAYVNEGQANSITSGMIWDGAVTVWDIRDGAVTTPKLADGAVTADKMQDGAALAEILDDDGSGSGLDADLLDGQHASEFAPVIHTHNAGNIISGILNTDRFSAYADLTAEGYLDNNAGTDLLTRDQADGRYLASISAWLPGGNAGTTAGTNFVGTTDNVALEFKVNGSRALRLEPNATSPNVIGGYSGNSVAAGVSGATIGGGGQSGFSNQVTADHGTVGGGYLNTASGLQTTVGGGMGNIAKGEHSTVGGGYSNAAYGGYGTVGGGYANAAVGLQTTVGGGFANAAVGEHSTVGGGYVNTANGNDSTVGGGVVNTASGENSTVGGGGGNTANGNDSTVGGGVWNTANGLHTTVGGGNHNTANGNDSTVGGGSHNTASGLGSSVPGGHQASAGLYGQMAYASGQFASAGDAQTSQYVMRRTTTSTGLWEELYLNGSSIRLTIASGRTMTFDILVVGRSDGGQSAGYRIEGIIEIDGETTAFTGTPTVTVLGEDDAAWDARVQADDVSDALLVQVQGNGETIRWVASVRTAEVAW